MVDGSRKLPLLNWGSRNCPMVDGSGTGLWLMDKELPMVAWMKELPWLIGEPGITYG